MLVDSQKSDQSTPEIDDAELAKLGGWQKQEVESVKQRSQANPSQPLPLLDEDDTVTPEEIKQERPWWMKGTVRMIVAGGGTLGVLHVMFSLLGLWGTSKQAPPAIVSTDPLAINQEVTARMEQLRTENENLKRDQIMGEPLPQPSPLAATQGVKVPKQPRVVYASAPPPRRNAVVQPVVPRRPVAYSPPPRPRAYTPPPRILPRPVITTPPRLATPPSLATPPTGLDPTAQWLAAANIGSYGSTSPGSNSQASSSQSDGDDNYQTANYQSNDDSGWSASGGIGTAPQEGNAGERDLGKGSTNKLNTTDSQSDSDEAVIYSNSTNSLVVGTKANGKLETPIAWSGKLENPNQNFLIQLNEPLKAADNTVAIPKGAYLVAKIGNATEAGLLQMSVSSMLINENGQSTEKPIPEGALLILGKGGKPLKASAQRPNTTGNNLGMVLLSGVSSATGLINRPSSQSTYSSDGYQSTTTTDDPNYLAGFGQGAAQSLLQQAQNRNQSSLRSRESEPTVFVLNQGAIVQVFVNQSASF